jgi:tetratricopeptide (TPR) repeat protein
VLEQALVEQDEELRLSEKERDYLERFAREHAGKICRHPRGMHEAAYIKRNRGKIFRMLGRADEARAAFATSLEIDRASVATAHAAGNVDAEAAAHWSIAQTLLELGDAAEARDEATLAGEQTPSGALRKNIDQWLERLDEDFPPAADAAG